MPFTLWKVSEPPILLLIPDLSCNKMVIGRELPSTLAKNREVLKKNFIGFILERGKKEERDTDLLSHPIHARTGWFFYVP